MGPLRLTHPTGLPSWPPAKQREINPALYTQTLRGNRGQTTVFLFFQTTIG